ncbi:hypothetical protein, partial [Saccharothrix sp. ST-888]|uniref:hypothetical protein n=1 Tax=Saccharothrix sp. ST-888 TaxID=1427391 RepID=UPI0012DFFF5F
MLQALDKGDGAMRIADISWYRLRSRFSFVRALGLLHDPVVMGHLLGEVSADRMFTAQSYPAASRLAHPSDDRLARL